VVVGWVGFGEWEEDEGKQRGRKKGGNIRFFSVSRFFLKNNKK
jgi:hypothetical protein